MLLSDLYVFSSNPKKLTELRRVFGSVRVASLGEAVPELPVVVEDGETFEENARKKAFAGAVACGFSTVADDSGLEVDALDGEPGVWSDRFAVRRGALADGADRAERAVANNTLLLDLLNGYAPPQRSARFVCALCCAIPEEILGEGVELPASISVAHDLGAPGWAAVTVRGTCEGRITESLSGSGGFGYDPLFWSVDLQKTFGQASPEEKQAVSHRGRAAEKLVSFLSSNGLL